MGLVVQAGERWEMSRAPPRMARCGHFSLTDSEYELAEISFSKHRSEYTINGDVTPEAENIDVVVVNIDTSPGEIETSKYIPYYITK